MNDKRIIKEQTTALPWFMPVLGVSGNVLQSHEKQVKDGKPERIQHLSAYLQNGRLSADVLDKLHQQIYEEASTKGQAEGYRIGHEQGFTQGKQSGYQAGYQEGKQRAEQEAIRLQQLLNQLFAGYEQQQQELRDWILARIKQICVAVLSHACQSDLTVLAPVVAEVVSALPVGARHITVCLHPEDKALLDQFVQQRALEWSVVANADLTRGDCIVRSAASTIDFTLAERVEQALQAMLKTDAGLNKPVDQHASIRH